MLLELWVSVCVGLRIARGGDGLTGNDHECREGGGVACASRLVVGLEDGGIDGLDGLHCACDCW